MTKAKTTTMIGVDISASSIKMAELRKGPRDKGYVLEQYAIEPLPREAVRDGNIDNLFAVSETIRAAWKRLGTQNTNVRLAVPACVAITKKIYLPHGSSVEGLESEAEIEADQYIPFALEEVYMDFIVMGPSPASADEVEILLAATRKHNVDDRVAAVLGEGLQAVAVDIESYAAATSLAQICTQLPGGAVDQCVALVHIGSNITNINVVRNGESVYARDHQIRGDQLTQQIQSVYGLSEEEAEAAKINGGLPANYESDVLAPFLENVADDVCRGLQFFFISIPDHEVHYIVLSGRSAVLAGLNEAVAAKTQVKTLVANPVAQMTLSNRVNPHQLQTEAPALMIACGLAMRGLDQSTRAALNFLPHRAAPTALQLERGLTDEDEIVRRRFARRTDFTPTLKQIERGLTDKDETVRLHFARRTDFTPTPKQIERGLADASFMVRSEFLESQTVRELLSYIRANSHSHLRVGLSPMCRASCGVEESNLEAIPDSQTIQLMMRVLLGPVEYRKFEKGSQTRFLVDLEESKFEVQLFHMNGQLGTSIRQLPQVVTPQMVEPQAAEAEHTPASQPEPEEVDKIGGAELFLNFGRTAQARERYSEINTKLDLAKSYCEMGDAAGAFEILEEVLREGDETQRSKAQELLKKIQAEGTPPSAEQPPKRERYSEVDTKQDVDTKLDLAQAYCTMGDAAGALEILEEVKELLKKVQAKATPPASEAKQPPKTERYSEVDTKLGLAQSYCTIVDAAGAIKILEEIQKLLKDFQAEATPLIAEAEQFSKSESWEIVKNKFGEAKLFLNVGKTVQAQEILEEVLREGDETQRSKAQELLKLFQAEPDKAPDVIKPCIIPIRQLLEFMVKQKGSDLHLRAGLPPVMRLHGDMRKINYAPLESCDIKNLMQELLGQNTFHNFERGLQSCFTVEVEGLANFRVQLAHANGLLAATIIVFPSRVLTLDELNIPGFLRYVTEIPRGLILINGKAGSGWSTTMAAMRHEILGNQNFCHGMTLGKGEYLNDSAVKGVHTSMLVGAGMDFDSYDEALKCAENMDPDYIFITERLDNLSSSEMRRVLYLARGHCVFASVNAGCTSDALRQIIGLLDYRDREFARHQLAAELRVSICQRLLKTSNGSGRVACHEFLVGYPGIRKAIENFDLDTINSALENDSDQSAISMKRSAQRLLKQRVITKQEFDRV